jgi:hypothetical protein
MHCSHIRIRSADGHSMSAIVCGRHRIARCCECGSPAGRLCDWKVGEHKTCDKPICDACSASPAPEKDLCPDHAKVWAAHPKNPQRSAA